MCYPKLSSHGKTAKKAKREDKTTKHITPAGTSTVSDTSTDIITSSVLFPETPLLQYLVDMFHFITYSLLPPGSIPTENKPGEGSSGFFHEHQITIFREFKPRKR
ncbi:hypothetical protein RJ640_024517 [Escallonia rubra]|uniref:Uncharacterized protein n=1 Tax=Escallonia rubra TaxID=112253 RepID=A0AA88RS32_9ASTE|nr:hypothetical protein RJ640_024517 [Escallonia rubra]